MVSTVKTWHRTAVEGLPQRCGVEAYCKGLRGGLLLCRNAVQGGLSGPRKLPGSSRWLEQLVELLSGFWGMVARRPAVPVCGVPVSSSVQQKLCAAEAVAQGRRVQRCQTSIILSICTGSMALWMGTPVQLQNLLTTRRRRKPAYTIHRRSSEEVSTLVLP